MQIRVEYERATSLQPDSACVICHVHYQYREGEQWYRVDGQLFCSLDCVNEKDNHQQPPPGTN